jgi:chromosome segregation ATPase
MKIKVAIVILAVACIGLGIALFVTKQQADKLHASDVNTMVDSSNQLVAASERQKELSQVNLALGQENQKLTNELSTSQEQLSLETTQMTQLSNSLAAADNALAETKLALAGTQQTVTNLNVRIASLEEQNKLLDQQANSLSNNLILLTAQIEDTKNHLAIAETNASFFQKELQKQLAQKAELEHKFNDLDELRGQVKKLKEEAFVARRVQLMKYDTGGKKGAELLISRPPPVNTPPVAKKPAANYDLNVEIGSDGSVKVIPPAETTNRPAH